jgi:hypothetical protein
MVVPSNEPFAQTQVSHEEAPLFPLLPLNRLKIEQRYLIGGSNQPFNGSHGAMPILVLSGPVRFYLLVRSDAQAGITFSTPGQGTQDPIPGHFHFYFHFPPLGYQSIALR